MVLMEKSERTKGRKNSRGECQDPGWLLTSASLTIRAISTGFQSRKYNMVAFHALFGSSNVTLQPLPVAISFLLWWWGQGRRQKKKRRGGRSTSGGWEDGRDNWSNKSSKAGALSEARSLPDLRGPEAMYICWAARNRTELFCVWSAWSESLT